MLLPCARPGLNPPLGTGRYTISEFTSTASFQVCDQEWGFPHGLR